MLNKLEEHIIQRTPYEKLVMSIIVRAILDYLREWPENPRKGNEASERFYSDEYLPKETVEYPRNEEEYGITPRKYEKLQKVDAAETAREYIEESDLLLWHCYYVGFDGYVLRELLMGIKCGDREMPDLLAEWVTGKPGLGHS